MCVYIRYIESLYFIKIQQHMTSSPSHDELRVFFFFFGYKSTGHGVWPTRSTLNPHNNSASSYSLISEASCLPAIIVHKSMPPLRPII